MDDTANDDDPIRAANSEEIDTDHRVPDEAAWTQVVQASYDAAETGGLTTTIVYAVAEAAGVEPRAIKSPPLYDVVDTAALEAAFFRPRPDATDDEEPASTAFVYRGFRVEVRSDGWVLVSERVDAD